MAVQRGKVTATTEPITTNNVITKPMKERDSYRYFGLYDNLGSVGPVNKERVTNSYYKHVKKIWKSKLSA